VDAAGNAITNPTPVKFLACQDISSDLSFDTKMLYGTNQFPLAIARGKGKGTVKAKNGQVNGAMLNNAFFGQTKATGQNGVVQDVSGTAIPATPFTITPTPPATGTWVADLGVRDSNGIPMTRVATTPTTGQYSVSAGVYTFAAADTLKLVFIDYKYSVTTGNNISIANQLLGSTPTVQLDISVPYGGKQLTITFPQAVAGKLALATKLDDFTIPEFNFDIFANPAGIVGTIGLAE
jgi:hypothetical protein